MRWPTSVAVPWMTLPVCYWSHSRPRPRRPHFRSYRPHPPLPRLPPAHWISYPRAPFSLLTAPVVYGYGVMARQLTSNVQLQRHHFTHVNHVLYVGDSVSGSFIVLHNWNVCQIQILMSVFLKVLYFCLHATVNFNAIAKSQFSLNT